MTARDDFDRASPEFDRLMAAWFDAEARVHEPDDLLERTISRTARMRPRPAWLLPERWIPMQLTMRRVQIPRSARYLMIVVLLLVAAALAYAIVGSSPRRIPPPFGPAANGVVTFATSNGDIAVVDPRAGTTMTIVPGPEVDSSPTFSLDGTRVAFVRRLDGGVRVMAVAAGGGGLTELTKDPLPNAGLLAWSPDGSRIAFESSGGLWIARADGSGADKIALDATVDAEIEWRPPDGSELLVRGTRQALAGLFLVKADGSGAPARALTPIDGGTNEYLWVTWSPDGRRFAYSNHPAKQVHIVTIDGPSDRSIQPKGGLDLMFPRWSPDGRRLAFMVWHPDDTTQIGVAPADDLTPTVTLSGPTFPSGIQFDWAPDGTTILAVGWTSDEPWLVDPDGGPGRRTTWAATAPDWIEWQRLAP